MKGSLNKIKLEIKFLLSKAKMINKSFNVSIMSIEETINKLVDSNLSMVRFGDGEFSLMGGKNVCPFQKEDDTLKKELIEVVNELHNDRVLICLPETMQSLKPFKRRTQKIWTINFADNYKAYRNNASETYLYGNAFVSRPYIIYKNTSLCGMYFEQIKKIFSGREIVIIEGEYSRSGVGNDLFEYAKSVQRILCPAQNAWETYSEILDAAIKIEKGKLILTSIGPTSKPLAMQLIKQGYRVLDMGHLDSEYEWFRCGASKKEKIEGKHTAELEDHEIQECTDTVYNNSIICRIKGG